MPFGFLTVTFATFMCTYLPAPKRAASHPITVPSAEPLFVRPFLQALGQELLFGIQSGTLYMYMY